MTSLFELGAEPPRLPHAMVADLVEDGGRIVSLLEFAAVEVETAAEDECGPVAEEFAVNERALQVAVMIEAAREAATREAWESANALQQAERAESRSRFEALCAELARDRRDYFAAAEQQAVRLALSIARRVLLRESNADPMLLSGTVKAALSKVQDGSVSRLLVAAGQAQFWREMVAYADSSFEVRESAQLEAGTIRLETSIGEVELGIRAQLEEIERGFAELMQEQVA